VKQVPRPGLLVAVIWPPWASTIRGRRSLACTATTIP